MIFVITLSMSLWIQEAIAEWSADYFDNMLWRNSWPITNANLFLRYCKIVRSRSLPHRINYNSLRKQPSFFAPGPSGISQEGPSRETPLGPEAKKDGCFRRLQLQIRVSIRLLTIKINQWARESVWSYRKINRCMFWKLRVQLQLRWMVPVFRTREVWWRPRTSRARFVREI